MTERVEVDEFHAHEVLHTVHVVRNLIYHELTEHPFVQAHPEVAQALEDATRALGAAYQLTGAVSFNLDPETVK